MTTTDKTAQQINERIQDLQTQKQRHITHAFDKAAKRVNKIAEAAISLGKKKVSVEIGPGCSWEPHPDPRIFDLRTPVYATEAEIHSNPAFQRYMDIVDRAGLHVGSKKVEHSDAETCKGTRVTFQLMPK